MIRSLLLFVLLTFFCFGVAAQVTGSVEPLKPGKTGKATVSLELSPELHANSNKPTGPNLIPTTVKVTAKGVRIGPVKYPKGHDRKFEFSPTPLNVYQGKTDFTFSVTVPSRYRAKSVSIDVAVRYQACTDEVCYPPKTKTITLTTPVN